MKNGKMVVGTDSRLVRYLGREFDSPHLHQFYGGIVQKARTTVLNGTMQESSPAASTNFNAFLRGESRMQRRKAVKASFKVFLYFCAGIKNLLEYF